jgi:hypothetical protein
LVLMICAWRGDNNFEKLRSCVSSRARPPRTSDQPAKVQFEAFLDEHRNELTRCLEGLSDEQARRSLVPSGTTLLGLVKHATFLEKVWFDEAVTCRPRAEIGIPASPDESFILDDDDTIATIEQAHVEGMRIVTPVDLDPAT